MVRLESVPTRGWRLSATSAAALAKLAERFLDDRLINFHAQRLAGGETGPSTIMTGK